MKKLFLFICIINLITVSAQETFSVNGTHNKIHNYYAFTNAVIHIDYQTKIENGTLVIKDGKIVAVGEKVDIPANSVVYDLKKKHIYPSLIDIYSDYGIAKPEKNKANRFNRQLDSKQKGAFNWNQAIKPEVEAGKLFKVDNKKGEELRNLGFGTVLTHQKDGIMRGTSALVTLGNDQAQAVMLKDNVANHLAFNKGSSSQSYPGSLMGMIALIRQTYYDVDWLFNNSKVDEYNISLNTIIENWKLPHIFEANDNSNLILQAVEVISSTNTANANTSSTSVYDPINHTCNTTIKFKASYLESATDLSIARTAIHESLHAIFVYMVEQELLQDSSGNAKLLTLDFK